MKAGLKKACLSMIGVAALVMVAGFGPDDSKKVTVDKAFKSYQQAQGVSGSIKSIGSDTLNNLMTGWTEAYRKFYPGVNAEVEGKGSSTAPPALTDDQAQFGPMSRPMKGEEMDKFEKKHGYKPTELRVAVDALAIFVHKDAPIEEISMENAMKVFSVAGTDMTWGDLGVTNPDFKSKPIALYGRNSASGTYGYFKEHVLQKKDFKATVKEQPGSSGVVQAVATDKFAMGYSGIGYATADVKALKVVAKGGKKAVAATAENAYSGEYPIGRFLLIYVNYNAKTGLDPLRSEFIKMLYSKDGQEIVVKDGYFPVTPEIAREDLKKVGVKADF
ncbi:MAG: PstS family phosphate ABC transporter substrate-binding protein [Tepidisphaera sp.]|jgi:phosphate transport system substrate-binding protein